jgi:hypothetical protein
MENPGNGALTEEHRKAGERVTVYERRMPRTTITGRPLRDDEHRFPSLTDGMDAAAVRPVVRYG